MRRGAGPLIFVKLPWSVPAQNPYLLLARTAQSRARHTALFGVAKRTLALLYEHCSRGALPVAVCGKYAIATPSPIRTPNWGGPDGEAIAGDI